MLSEPHNVSIFVRELSVTSLAFYIYTKYDREALKLLRRKKYLSIA